MTEGYIELTHFDLLCAALLIVVNAAISLVLKLKMERMLMLAAVRTVAQLLLIGLVLETIFRWERWYAVASLLVLMTFIASRTAVGRTKRRYPGIYVDSFLSIATSTWLMTGFAMSTVLRDVHPWFHPQFTVPLTGMILGNTLNGISLGLNHLQSELTQNRSEVEMLLSLGATRWEAAKTSITEALRTGMIPIINTMMVVGIVSLPGMMTGQLLAGAPPIEAVKYQVVIMFLIAAGTALGTLGVVLLAYRRVFNKRHQFLSFTPLEQSPS